MGQLSTREREGHGEIPNPPSRVQFIQVQGEQPGWVGLCQARVVSQPLFLDLPGPPLRTIARKEENWEGRLWLVSLLSNLLAALFDFSDTRENLQEFFGRGHEDSEADQEANRAGRRGEDPNKYRPRGLPDKY